MYTSLSGQIAAYKQLELIANNLANMTTTGFKAERPQFEKVLNNQRDVLSSSLRKDIEEPNRLPTQEFGRLKGSYVDLAQGPLETTGNPLDVAIDGKGFFVVATPQGEQYTRAGSFTLDAQGRIVTQDGLPVQGQGGEINVGPGNVAIADDGTVKVNNQSIGKLRIVQIEAKDLVRHEGQRFSLKPGAAATDVTFGRVVGGALEGSNVNAVKELTEMIYATRLFESFKSAQEASSKMSQLRNERVGSTQG